MGSRSTRLNVLAATLRPVPLRVRMRARLCVTATVRAAGVSGASGAMNVTPLGVLATPARAASFASPPIVLEDLNALLGAPPSLRAASGFLSTMEKRLG